MAVINPKPEIRRVVPKDEQTGPFDGAEVQLLCAIKDCIEWALRESRSPRTHVEVKAKLQYEGFHVEQRVSFIKIDQRWGESISQRTVPRSRADEVESNHGELDHALNAVRKELNTLSPGTHLTRKSSIQMILVFEDGWLKSCDLSRMRAAYHSLSPIHAD